MSLPIPPGISDITVDLVAMSLDAIGVSASELIEVGDLDFMNFVSRETTGLGCLWKTTSRGFPTARMVVTTKLVSLTDGLFLNFSMIGSSLLVIWYVQGYRHLHIPHW